MTRQETITVEHLHALLNTTDPASKIVLLGGKVEVLEAAQLDTEEKRGALEVISRDELAERHGDQAGEHELRALAAALTTAIAKLGG